MNDPLMLYNLIDFMGSEKSTFILSVTGFGKTFNSTF